MPIGIRQCQKFMAIAEFHIKNKTNPGSLGINVEAALTNVSSVIQQKVRASAKAEPLSQHELMPLIKELKEEEIKANSKKSSTKSTDTQTKSKKITREKLVPKIHECVLQIKAECALPSDAELEDGVQDLIDHVLAIADALQDEITDKPEPEVESVPEVNIEAIPEAA